MNGETTRLSNEAYQFGKMVRLIKEAQLTQSILTWPLIMQWRVNLTQFCFKASLTLQLRLNLTHICYNNKLLHFSLIITRCLNLTQFNINFLSVVQLN